MRRWRTERPTEKGTSEEERAGMPGRITLVISSISIVPNGNKVHQLCHSVTPRKERDVVLPIL